MGGTSSPAYTTDALGNLIPLDPSNPIIAGGGDGSLFFPNGTTQSGTGLALADLVPALPWWAWALIGAGGMILLRGVIR